MIPTEHAIIYEGELASFWFDEDGILCSNAKPVHRTLENQKKHLALIRQIIGDDMVFLLSDNTATYTQDNLARAYSAQEMPKLFKAVAIISSTTIGKAAAHLFTYFHGQPVPIRVFDNKKDAKEWLRQFMHEVV